jgi:hypothetical protein
MKIVYEIGPKRIAIGDTEFYLNQPKEVPNDIGEIILKKKTIVFKKVDGETEKVKGKK